jgi:hypothetical protein
LVFAFEGKGARKARLKTTIEMGAITIGTNSFEANSFGTIEGGAKVWKRVVVS